MRALGGVLAATSVALIVAGFAARRDPALAVPPPELVAEQFARHVAARRYDRALTHVDEHPGITLATVRRGGDALRRRAGGVNQVEGEPGAVDDRRATAAVVVTTQRAGRIRYAFHLERQKGLWKVVNWREETQSGRTQ